VGGGNETPRPVTTLLSLRPICCSVHVSSEPPLCLACHSVYACVRRQRRVRASAQQPKCTLPMTRGSVMKLFVPLMSFSSTRQLRMTSSPRCTSKRAHSRTQSESITLHCTTLNCAVLHCTVLYYTALCCTKLYALYYTLLCAVLYYTLPYYTVHACSGQHFSFS
jgi:hypothetical protein